MKEDWDGGGGGRGRIKTVGKEEHKDVLWRLV